MASSKEKSISQITEKAKSDEIGHRVTSIYFQMGYAAIWKTVTVLQSLLGPRFPNLPAPGLGTALYRTGKFVGTPEESQKGGNFLGSPLRPLQRIPIDFPGSSSFLLAIAQVRYGWLA
jgi:hypothetical protein